MSVHLHVLVTNLQGQFQLQEVEGVVVEEEEGVHQLVYHRVMQEEGEGEEEGVHQLAMMVVLTLEQLKQHFLVQEI